MLKKNGFTLAELLAVLVVLAIIILVASSSVAGIVANVKKKAQGEIRNNLKEAGLNYVIGNIYLEKCSVGFSNELKNNNTSNVNSNGACLRKVSVKTLKDNGIFEDEKKYCKDTDEVIVYRYNDGTNSEYRAYVSDTSCTN